MTTWCSQIRTALNDGRVALDEPPVVEHLSACADCARFAHRLEAFREALRDHHAGVEPDAAFAARLRGRLPETPVDLIGRAAWRLLPLGMAATVALVATIAVGDGGLAGRLRQLTGDTGAGETALVAVAEPSSPLDDPLGWLLDDADTEPER